MAHASRLGIVTWLVLGLVAAGCATPSGATRSTPPQLLVANAGDGTVSRFLLPDGVPAGAAARVGLALDQITAGPHGSVLATALGAERRHLVIQLTAGGLGASWHQRTVILDPTGPEAEDVLLASDGGRWAAAAFRRRGVTAGRCSLALIDAAAGIVTQEHAVCGPGETVRALALANRGDEAAVYLALERAGGASGAGDGDPSGRIAVLEGRSGRTIGSLPLAGVPTALLLAAGAGGDQPVVYCFEARGGPELEPPRPYDGRLVVLDAETLVPAASYALQEEPPRLSVAPDGDAVYVLNRDALVALDPATGVLRLLARLPQRGLALVATAEHVYVAGAYGNEVWAIDRRTGARVRSISTGRGPVALALRG